MGDGDGTTGSGEGAAIPEALKGSLSDISAEELAVVQAFFRLEGREARLTGTRQIILERERRDGGEAGSGSETQIVLKLDFDSYSWKRVRKKVCL